MYVHICSYTYEYLYICIYTCIRIWTNSKPPSLLTTACAHTHTYMYINLYTYIFIHIWIFIYMHIYIIILHIWTDSSRQCVFSRVYIHIYVYVYLYTYIYIYTYVYMYIYMYIYVKLNPLATVRKQIIYVPTPRWHLKEHMTHHQAAKTHKWHTHVHTDVRTHERT